MYPYTLSVSGSIAFFANSVISNRLKNPVDMAQINFYSEINSKNCRAVNNKKKPNKHQVIEHKETRNNENTITYDASQFVCIFVHSGLKIIL